MADADADTLSRDEDPIAAPVAEPRTTPGEMGITAPPLPTPEKSAEVPGYVSRTTPEGDRLTREAVEARRAEAEAIRGQQRLQDEYIRTWIDSNKRSQEAATKQLEANKRAREEELKIIRERETTLADQQKMQQQQKPLPPPPDLHKYAHNGADAISAFMAIAPKGMMSSGMMGIQALTGWLKGYYQGDNEQMKLEVDNWRLQSEYIRDTNAQLEKRYTDALNNNKLSFEAKKQEMELIAGEFQDTQTLETLRMNNMKTFDDMMKTRADLAGRLAESATKAAELQDKHDKESKMQTRLMSDDALMQRVRDKFSGLPEVEYMSRIRAGSADAARFGELSDQYQKTMGYTSQDLIRARANYAGDVAGGRSTGVREANLETAQYRLSALIGPALEASRAVSRTKFVPANQAMQLWQRGTSDPAMYHFGMINFQLSELFASQIKPTGVLDVRLQQSAIDQLMTTTSPEVYATMLNDIALALDREVKAVKDKRAGAPITYPDIPEAYRPPASATPSGTVDPGWSVKVR